VVPASLTLERIPKPLDEIHRSQSGSVDSKLLWRAVSAYVFSTLGSPSTIPVNEQGSRLVAASGLSSVELPTQISDLTYSYSSVAVRKI